MEEQHKPLRVLFFNPLYAQRREPPFQTSNGARSAESGVDFQGLHADPAKQSEFIRGYYATPVTQKKTILTALVQCALLPKSRFSGYDVVFVLGNLPLIGILMRRRYKGTRFAHYTFATDPPSQPLMLNLFHKAMARTHGLVVISHKQVHEHDGKAYFHQVGIDESYWLHDAPYPTDANPEIEQTCRGALLVVGESGRNDDVVLQMAQAGHRVVRITRHKSVFDKHQQNLATHPELAGKLCCFHGITFAELRRAYQVCRAVVLPLRARKEPWGMNSLMEAQIMGKPVITDHDYTYECLSDEEKPFVRFVPPSELLDQLPKILDSLDGFDAEKCAQVYRQSRTLLGDELQLKEIAQKIASAP